MISVVSGRWVSSDRVDCKFPYPDKRSSFKQGLMFNRDDIPSSVSEYNILKFLIHGILKLWILIQMRGCSVENSNYDMEAAK